MKQLNFTLILLILSIYSFGGHIQGGSINYKRITGNNYQVTVSVYRNCSGVQYTSPSVSISTKCGSTTSTFNLKHAPYYSTSASFLNYSAIHFTSNGNKFQIKEVSAVCDRVLDPNRQSETRCRNSQSIIEGTTRFTYSGVVNLPACSNREIWTQIAPGRFTRGSNISTASVTYVSKFNNQTFPNQQPPQNFFETDHPVLNACVGSNLSISLAVSDPNNDRLKYELVCSFQNPTTCVSYNSGFSSTNPIQGASLDTNTGLFTCRPTTTGMRFISYQVTEYDSCTNQWKGNSVREFYINVRTCTNTGPTYTKGISNLLGAGATKIDSFKITALSGTTIEFNDTIKDPNSSDSIFLVNSPIANLPGASDSLRYLASNRLVYSVKWNIPKYFSGTHLIKPHFTDNSCNYRNDLILGYRVQIPPRLSHKSSNTRTFDSLLIFKGDTVDLKLTGNGKAQWLTLSGSNILFSGTNFNAWGDTTLSDTNQQIFFKPDSSTVLVASSLVRNGCVNTFSTDTIYIKVIPPFNISIPNDTTVCSSVDSIPIWVRTDSSYRFTYRWSANSGNALADSTSRTTFAYTKRNTKYCITVTSPQGGVREGCFNVSIKNNVEYFNILSNQDQACDSSLIVLKPNFKNPNSACSNVNWTRPTVYKQTFDSLNKFTAKTGSQSAPNPVLTEGLSSRQQYLLRKSFLKSKGILSGNFYEINFFLDSVSNKTWTYVIPSLEVYMTCIADSNLNTWQTKVKPVARKTNFKLKGGWNTIKLDSGYHWNNDSNLIIQFCVSHNSAPPNIASAAYHVLNYNTTLVSKSNLSTASCSSTGLTFAPRNRLPVFKFGIIPEPDTSDFKYQWKLNGRNISTSVTTSKKVSINSTFQLIIEDSAGVCSDTAYKSIKYMNPTISINGLDSACARTRLKLTSNIDSNLTGMYQWYSKNLLYTPRFKNTDIMLRTSDSIVVKFIGSNGCIIKDTAYIKALPLPSATVLTTGPFCESDSSILLRGAAPGSKFSGTGVKNDWLNPADPLLKPSLNVPKSTAIQYTATGNNGCKKDTTIYVLIYPQFDTSLLTQRVFCVSDAAVKLKTRHNGGIWSGTGVDSNAYFNPQKASVGNHLIKVDSTGFCGNKAEYTMIVNALPKINFPDTIFGCNKTPATIDAQNSGSIYKWNTGETTQTINAKADSAYWVLITDNNNCKNSDTVQVKITEICIGLNQQANAANTVIIYPNPASNWVTIDANNVKIQSVSIFDITGKELLKKEFTDESKIIFNVAHLLPGSYVIVINKEIDPESYRFIINK